MLQWDESQFERIFLENTPLLDVRAPVEFAQGAFPTAVNVPILNDQERTQVGICYKQNGPEAANALGHRLVSGAVKAERVSQWIRFFDKHPEGALYCFRGGQRSRIAQQWLKAEGLQVPRIQGGYKALRNYLIARLAQLCACENFCIIGGRTGTGKTQLLQWFRKAVDLEAEANHRGSAFGRHVTEQPAQIDFEHRVTIRLLQTERIDGPWLLEDESRLIGRLCVPLPLQSVLKRAPLVVIEADMNARVQEVFYQYVLALGEEYRAAFGDEGMIRHRDALLSGLARIRKRLGGVRYLALQGALKEAFSSTVVYTDVEGHRAWIQPLLEGYYDRMYDYQLRNKSHRIVFQGDADSVKAWLVKAKGAVLQTAPE